MTFVSTRSALVLALVAAAACLGRDARAADAEDQAAAEALFADGRALMRDGDVAEACRKFAESYRLDATPGTLLNLALCHEKEGKIASAWAEYRQSAVEARRSGRADREQIADERAESLAPRLPMLTVVVPPESQATGLRVERNRTVIEQGGWGTPLPVDPGTVEITARAPLHRPWSTTIAIGAGERRSVTVPPLAVDEQATAAAAQAAPKSSWGPRRTWAIVSGGAGAIALGVGAYFGIAALDSKHRSELDCPTVQDELRCSDRGAAESRAATQQAWAANVAIGLGVIGIGTAVVLLLTDRHDAGEHAVVGATPRPHVTFGSGGAGTGGLRVVW